MRNYFILDGVDSRDFGVYISGQGTFSAPQKAYQFYNIPGRNGALLGNEHRLENINVSYEAFIYSNFDENIAAFRTFLVSLNGYKKLTDSYHPDEFRMAVYEGPFEPKVTKMNDAGSFVITFSCKPQRFLFSGDTEYSLLSGQISGNPVYTEISDITPSSLSIAINVPYANASNIDINPKAYQTASKVILKIDGSTIWQKTLANPSTIVAATVTPQSGATITKVAENLPATGWVKLTGYGSVYTVDYNAGGNVLACNFMKLYEWTGSITTGRIYYDSTNYKIILAAPANLTTLSAFENWYGNIKNKQFVVQKSSTLSWSDTVTLTSGEELTAFVTVSGSQVKTVATISATVTGSNTLENPTAFPSKPLIRLYGNGTATVNGQTITVTNSTVYVDIDCDIMDCYEGSTNRNNDVAFSTYDFPELKVGTNTFLAGTGITGIRVTPRWWRV